MNDSIFITFLLTAVALLVIGVFFYCHHERRLQDIESQGGNRSNRSVLLSIERFVKIIAIAAVLFCTGVAIHYCCVFFPRYTSAAPNKAYYENFGVDYWGIVVGFMALLVTLLVGWQIYSTIRAREELREVKDDATAQVNNIRNTLKDEIKAGILLESNIQTQAQIDEMRNEINKQIEHLRGLPQMVNKYDSAMSSMFEGKTEAAFRAFMYVALTDYEENFTIQSVGWMSNLLTSENVEFLKQERLRKAIHELLKRLENTPYESEEFKENIAYIKEIIGKADKKYA